ncbi:MAG: 16S rRNA (uracil(1498)-N(3))-methyltransferase [Acidobacteria bacterium]|nr:16S rRNA (uracil(1498)-N(3))-methyltransferase [Acidobacteriota bacterium]
MLPRFFVPGTHAEDSVIELPREEAAHLARVLRLSTGDVVRIFDGRGREWQATVDQVRQPLVTVSLQHEVAPLAEPGVAITLGVAVLKGDKMDDVMRDAVMLGVAAIQPLITERTEVALAVIERGDRVARWRRVAVASAKQCGRAVVPVVNDVVRFEDALRNVAHKGGDAVSPAVPTVMLAEPHAVGEARSLREVPRSGALLLLVGPEGGWTPREVQHARDAGVMLVTLGTQILRADAVPIVALTAVRVAFHDL